MKQSEMSTKTRTENVFAFKWQVDDQKDHNSNSVYISAGGVWFWISHERMLDQ